jgi:two-component sensor histidine kinase
MTAGANGLTAARPARSDLPARHRAAALSVLRTHVDDAGADGHLNLASYLRALCDIEQRTLPAAVGVAVYADLKPVAARAETAVLIGLAFRELLRNALVHAYAPGDAGHVGVHLWRVRTLPHVRAFLLVADGGRGFADEPPATANRGIPLARQLVQRCGGALARELGRGTIWRIALPRTAGPTQATTAGRSWHAPVGRDWPQSREP